MRGRWPLVPVHKFRTGAPSWGISVHCTFSAALIKRKCLRHTEDHVDHKSFPHRSRNGV